MKIAFWENKGLGVNTAYTQELLKHIAIKNGHDIKSDPEIIAVSMTSHYEIEELKRARKEYPHKKIIVGGHCSNAPESLLKWADYVNLGQGFEFFRDVKSIAYIEKQKYIVSKEKKEGEYSQYIDWNMIPCVQISKHSYSYLESVGCVNKCKFCLTSWLNKHQVNPNQQKIKGLQNKLQKKQLYFIGNNYESISCDMNVSDVTIKGYNQNYSKYTGIKLIRVGLESPDESTRKTLGKDITDEQVRNFFCITKQQKKRCNIFFIAGFNTQEQWENFTEIMPYCPMESSPGIGIVINYFDASLGTPMQNYDMTKIIPLNIPKIKRLWKLHNARIKIFHDHTISWKNSTINTLLQRCKPEDVEAILKIKQIVFTDINDMFTEIKKAGLEEILIGNRKSEYKFKNWHKELT